MTDDLHVTELGDSGPRVAFCHGLFGQGRNWTAIAKRLADTHRVQLIDMPNHGQSAWTERFDYLDLADRVAALFAADDPVALVGHSMGGKIAMALALRHPDRVARLAVVDVAPVEYAGRSEFAGYIAGMQAVDLSAIGGRDEADAALVEAVPSRTVRGFLLQNLRRVDAAEGGTGWRWMPNLELLARDLELLGGWPAERLAEVPAYREPVLWIAGADSDYVRDEYAPEMERWFPAVRRVTIKNAGHWVHSEQPEVFGTVLERFLAG